MNPPADGAKWFDRLFRCRFGVDLQGSSDRTARLRPKASRRNPLLLEIHDEHVGFYAHEGTACRCNAIGAVRKPASSQIDHDFLMQQLNAGGNAVEANCTIHAARCSKVRFHMRVRFSRFRPLELRRCAAPERRGPLLRIWFTIGGHAHKFVFMLPRLHRQILGHDCRSCQVNRTCLFPAIVSICHWHPPLEIEPKVRPRAIESNHEGLFAFPMKGLM